MSQSDRITSPKKKILVITKGGRTLSSLPCAVDYLIPDDQTAIELLRKYPPLHKTVPSLAECTLSLQDLGDRKFDPIHAIYITNATCGDRKWHDLLNDPARP